MYMYALYIYIYIYIHTEREREKQIEIEREMGGKKICDSVMSTCNTRGWKMALEIWPLI